MLLVEQILALHFLVAGEVEVEQLKQEEMLQMDQGPAMQGLVQEEEESLVRVEMHIQALAR